MTEKETPTEKPVRPEGEIPLGRGNDETLRIIHEQAKRGYETPGCDNWRAVEMCRQIMRLSEAEPATPTEMQRFVGRPIDLLRHFDSPPLTIEDLNQ